MADRNDYRARRLLVIVAAVGWASLVTLAVVRSEIDPRPLAVLLALIPGGALFLYTALRPTTPNIACRSIAALAGLITFFQASNSVSSGGCNNDGLCGLNIFNGVFIDLLTFLLGWLAILWTGHRRENRTQAR